MPTPTRADFLLDPDLVFLNHGSFGAVPRVVQEAYEARLFDEFRIEAPLPEWNDQKFIRVGFAAHNTEADSDALLAALTQLP